MRDEWSKMMKRLPHPAGSGVVLTMATGDSVGAADAVGIDVGVKVEGGTVGVEDVGAKVGVELLGEVVGTGVTGDPVGGAVSPTTEMSHDCSLAARQHMTPSLCRTSSPPPQLSHRNTRGLPRPPDRALEQKSTLDPLNITEPSSVPQVTERSERSPAKLSVAMAEMTLPSAFLQDPGRQSVVYRRSQMPRKRWGRGAEIGNRHVM